MGRSQSQNSQTYQIAGNSTLTTINSKVPALVSGRTPVVTDTATARESTLGSILSYMSSLVSSLNDIIRPRVYATSTMVTSSGEYTLVVADPEKAIRVKSICMTSKSVPGDAAIRIYQAGSDPAKNYLVEGNFEIAKTSNWKLEAGKDLMLKLDVGIDTGLAVNIEYSIE